MYNETRGLVNKAVGQQTMLIYDFDGEMHISHETDLVRRLHSTKKGQYGAFILSHGNDAASFEDGPFMYVHIAGDLGYAHYFNGGVESHAGFQPAAHEPITTDSVVQFLQTDGAEANAIEIPAEIVITAEQVRQAAVEFFRNPKLPASVTWFEL